MDTLNLSSGVLLPLFGFSYCFNRLLHHPSSGLSVLLLAPPVSLVCFGRLHPWSLMARLVLHLLRPSLLSTTLFLFPRYPLLSFGTVLPSNYFLSSLVWVLHLTGASCRRTYLLRSVHRLCMVGLHYPRYWPGWSLTDGSLPWCSRYARLPCGHPGAVSRPRSSCRSRFPFFCLSQPIRCSPSTLLFFFCCSLFPSPRRRWVHNLLDFRGARLIRLVLLGVIVTGLPSLSPCSHPHTCH